MNSLSPESIAIVLGQEDDGRWWADIESMPGVMAYGSTREAAISAVRALALPPWNGGWWWFACSSRRGRRRQIEKSSWP